MGDPAAACAKSSTCFRRAICAIASLRFLKMKLCSPNSSSIVSKEVPGLEGHSFGNLFLAALTSITGDFAEAVRLSSEILLTRGHIFPATMSNVELEALLEDGTRVRGETHITASKGKIRSCSWFLRTSSRFRRRSKPLPGRPDHGWPGFAVHQPDSELAGPWHYPRRF